MPNALILNSDPNHPILSLALYNNEQHDCFLHEGIVLASSLVILIAVAHLPNTVYYKLFKV